uniref:Uncharacterized protein n=1 Tax=mine drainage metagenome TaxID=410659 RepID=E6QVA7_9ZZZZ
MQIRSRFPFGSPDTSASLKMSRYRYNDGMLIF